MKYLVHLALILLLSACGARDTTPARPGLADLRGQWIVINYWAQWCKPCIEEIPELNTLDQTYPGITVLGVNYEGTSGEALAQQEDALGVEFATLAQDPAAELGVPRPVVLPTTLVLNPRGELVSTLVGPQTVESLAEITVHSN